MPNIFEQYHTVEKQKKSNPSQEFELYLLPSYTDFLRHYHIVSHAALSDILLQGWVGKNIFCKKLELSALDSFVLMFFFSKEEVKATLQR